MEAHDDTSAPAPRTRREAVKLPLWVTLALVGLLVAVVAWRQFSVISTERRFEAERQEITERLRSEQGAALVRAQQALVQQSDEAFRLFGAALGWTVRSAMMRENRDEIDQYFTLLVKHERVRLVLLAAPNEKILVSSDRNFQDSTFSKHFPAALLLEPKVVIRPGEGQLKRLVVPIHGLSEQLGTVLVVYEAPSLPAN